MLGIGISLVTYSCTFLTCLVIYLCTHVSYFLGGFQKSTSDSLVWLLRSVRLVRSFSAWSFVLVRSVRLFSRVSSLDISCAVNGSKLLVSSQILSGFFMQFLRRSPTDSSV